MKKLISIIKSLYWWYARQEKTYRIRIYFYKHFVYVPSIHFYEYEENGMMEFQGIAVSILWVRMYSEKERGGMKWE